jgi:hypothetical protein
LKRSFLRFRASQPGDFKQRWQRFTPAEDLPPGSCLTAARRALRGAFRHGKDDLIQIDLYYFIRYLNKSNEILNNIIDTLKSVIIFYPKYRNK